MIPRLRYTDTIGVLSGPPSGAGTRLELARHGTAADLAGAAAQRRDETRVSELLALSIVETRWNRSLELTRCGRDTSRLSDRLTCNNVGCTAIRSCKLKNSPIRMTGRRRPSINLCVDYSTVSHFDNTQDP